MTITTTTSIAKTQVNGHFDFNSSLNLLSYHMLCVRWHWHTDKNSPSVMRERSTIRWVKCSFYKFLVRAKWKTYNQSSMKILLYIFRMVCVWPQRIHTQFIIINCCQFVRRLNMHTLNRRNCLRRHLKSVWPKKCSHAHHVDLQCCYKCTFCCFIFCFFFISSHDLHHTNAFMYKLWFPQNVVCTFDFSCLCHSKTLIIIRTVTLKPQNQLHRCDQLIRSIIVLRQAMRGAMDYLSFWLHNFTRISSIFHFKLYFIRWFFIHLQ